MSPSRSQERGGDSRKYADTLGELDRPAEAPSAGLVSARLGEEEQCSTK